MERVKPEQPKEEKIYKIVEETLNMLKNLEKDGKILILEEEKIKEKIKEMFRKESEKKIKIEQSFWEAFLSVKEFLEAGIKENLIEIQGKDEEEKEANRQLLIERLRSEIYKIRSYKEL
jgi:transcriptional regulator